LREIRTEENLVKSIADATAPLIRSFGFSRAVTVAMKQYERMLPTDDVRRLSIRKEVENELRRRAIAVRKRSARQRAEIKRSPELRFQFRPIRKV